MNQFTRASFQILILSCSVQFEGVLNDDQTPYLIDLSNSGSQIVPDFDIVMPERWFVPGQPELLYVPGSNYATMFVWGEKLLESIRYM